jgi:hypothetical protein
MYIQFFSLKTNALLTTPNTAANYSRNVYNNNNNNENQPNCGSSRIEREIIF